ncbi:MAG TPA: FtsX-like permease family protein, partial [Pseudoneobacillus sp.]|nr:FtsX-like permease family protein [Pseudoneobacillus sp.]
GVLILVLGITLVANIIFSILNGQMKQIGIMQVIGATTNQVAFIYLLKVFFLGAIATIIGIPLSIYGARAMTSHSNTLLNFDSSQQDISISIICIQFFIGIGIPLISALIPVLIGSKISIREAIQSYGTSVHFGLNHFDNFLSKLTGFPTQIVLAIRNSFRKKGRLILTIFTLSIGGAIVISIISLYSSIEKTKINSLQYSNYDIQIVLNKPHSLDELEKIIKENVKDVKKIEGWNGTSTFRNRKDGSKSQPMRILEPTGHTSLIRPVITEGKWLEAEEKNTIVLDTYWLRKEKDIKIGDQITLEIYGKPQTYKVVGFSRKVAGEVISYVSEQSLRSEDRTANKINVINIVLKTSNRGSQADTIELIKEKFKLKGISILSYELREDLKEKLEIRFSIVLIFLYIMSFLLVIVSSISLTGMMGLNVLERTREIGILRCIGASDTTIQFIIMFEGVTVGFISWVVSVLWSMPFSHQLSTEVGMALFQAPLDYVFSYTGIWIWLGLSTIFSIVWSYIPAWNASRLTIKDVLNYE